MMKCPYCGTPIEDSIHHSTVCPNCRKELHTCEACRFHHLGSHYDCLEDTDELVQDKNMANYCESYSLSEQRIAARKTDREKDRAAFDALFKL